MRTTESKGLNGMTTHTQTGTLLRVKEGNIKNYTQTTGKHGDCNRQLGHIITLKLSKVRRLKRGEMFHDILVSGKLETRSMLP